MNESPNQRSSTSPTSSSFNNYDINISTTSTIQNISTPQHNQSLLGTPQSLLSQTMTPNTTQDEETNPNYDPNTPTISFHPRHNLNLQTPDLDSVLSTRRSELARLKSMRKERDKETGGIQGLLERGEGKKKERGPRDELLISQRSFVLTSLILHLTPLCNFPPDRPNISLPPSARLSPRHA